MMHEIHGPLAEILAATASTIAGAAVGSVAGGRAALTEVANNYLKHKDVIELADELRLCKAGEAVCTDAVPDDAKNRSEKNNMELLGCGSNQLCVQEHWGRVFSKRDVVFVAIIIEPKRLVLAWCIDIFLVESATGALFTLALHFFAVIEVADGFDRSLGAKK